MRHIHLLCWRINIFLFLVKVLLPHERALLPEDTEMRGVLARVIADVEPGRLGEVLFTLNGTRRSAAARSESGPRASGRADAASLDSRDMLGDAVPSGSCWLALATSYPQPVWRPVHLNKYMSPNSSDLRTNRDVLQIMSSSCCASAFPVAQVLMHDSMLFFTVVAQRQLPPEALSHIPSRQYQCTPI